MKTVVLSSAQRVAGSSLTDAQVEIKDQLLDPFKQYRCKVRFFAATVTSLQTLFLYIDGLAMQEHFSSTPVPVFACLNTFEWIDLGSVWQIVSEPRNHHRIVTVSNNLLRIRLQTANGSPAPLLGAPIAEEPSVPVGWTLELAFEEI